MEIRRFRMHRSLLTVKASLNLILNDIRVKYRIIIIIVVLLL